MPSFPSNITRECPPCRRRLSARSSMPRSLTVGGQKKQSQLSSVQSASETPPRSCRGRSPHNPVISPGSPRVCALSIRTSGTRIAWLLSKLSLRVLVFSVARVWELSVCFLSARPPSHTLGPTSPHPHAHCQDNRLSGPCWSRRPALPRRKRAVSAPGVAPPPRAGLVPGLAQQLKPFTFTLARGDRRWGGRKLTAAMPRPHLCPIAFPRRGLVLRWHWESVAGFSDVWPTPL